jgi:hypothetical protein
MPLLPRCFRTVLILPAGSDLATGTPAGTRESWDETSRSVLSRAWPRRELRRRTPCRLTTRYCHRHCVLGVSDLQYLCKVAQVASQAFPAGSSPLALQTDPKVLGRELAYHITQSIDEGSRSTACNSAASPTSTDPANPLLLRAASLEPPLHLDGWRPRLNVHMGRHKSHHSAV